MLCFVLGIQNAVNQKAKSHENNYEMNPILIVLIQVFIVIQAFEDRIF